MSTWPWFDKLYCFSNSFSTLCITIRLRIYIHRYVSKNDCKMKKLIFWFVFSTLLIYICCRWLVEVFLKIFYQCTSTCDNLTFAFQEIYKVEISKYISRTVKFPLPSFNVLLWNFRICIINKYYMFIHFSIKHFQTSIEVNISYFS
jgi:hypothetical protein